MISETSKKWIEACKLLGVDSTKKVKCPKCGQVDLQVQDVINEENNILVERILYCSFCGARNFIRLNQLIK